MNETDKSQLETLKKVNAQIQNEDIQKLPLAKPYGETLLLETHKDFEKAWQKFKKDFHISTVIGFDTESRPAFKKGQSFPVCLIQLSGPVHTLLIRLNKIELPEEVKIFLENPEFTKVGLAIRDDIKGLQEITPMTPRGFVDLSEEADKLNFKKLGLKNLAATLLGKKLSKKAKLSNWEAKKLSDAQVDYAALDAQISRDLYFSLKEFSDTQ